MARNSLAQRRHCEKMARFTSPMGLIVAACSYNADPDWHCYPGVFHVEGRQNHVIAKMSRRQRLALSPQKYLYAWSSACEEV